MNQRIELYVSEQHPQLNANVKYLHLTHIQSLDNASCMEIEVGDCLDYALERNELLQIIISKLRYNSILKIEGVDLEDIIYQYSVGQITVPQLQELLYSGRLSGDTYENMVDKLKGSKLTIIQESLDNNRYHLVAKRELKK